MSTEKRPSRNTIIAVVVAALCVVTVVTAVLLYRRHVRETKIPSKVAAHLPDHCELLVKVDVRKSLASPAVAAQLGPAMHDVGPEGSGPRKVLAELAIDPEKDVAEVVACMAGDAGKPKLVFVIAGDFKPESIARAIVDTDSTPPEQLEIDGRKAISRKEKHGDSTLVTQAKDGAIVIGNDRAMVESAVVPSDRSTAYGLSPDAEVTFAIGSKMFRLMGERGRPGTALGGSKGASGWLRLDGRFELSIRAADASQATTLVKELKEAVDDVLASKEKPGRFGEVAALANAKITANGDTVTGSAKLPENGVAELAKAFSTQIKGAAGN